MDDHVGGSIHFVDRDSNWLEYYFSDSVAGYGNVCPKSELGRFLVIPFSVIGVPLMLMFIANVGEFYNTVLRVGAACIDSTERQKLYYDVICAVCKSRRVKNHRREQHMRIRIDRDGKPMVDSWCH